jgi:hypothetical protein
MPLEKRNSERAMIAIAVRVRFGNKIYICQASNISTEGIFLAHVKDGSQATEGMKCWLEFSLPGYPATLIAARGLVLRQRTHARFVLSAIRFACIAPSHRRLINQYVGGPHLASPAPPFLPPAVNS